MVAGFVWAHYFKDELIAFRPPEESDAGKAFQWHDGIVPLTALQAQDLLKESETFPWGMGQTIRLIAGTIESGEIVGSGEIDRHEQRVETLAVTPSRALPVDRQRDIAVRMLTVVLPWLSDEVAVMSITLRIPDDHDHMIESASSHGFRRVATYREHVLRPHGHIDLHLYQLLNPNWILPRDSVSTHA